MKILSNKQLEKMLKFAFTQGILQNEYKRYDVDKSFDKYVNESWKQIKDIVTNINPK